MKKKIKTASIKKPKKSKMVVANFKVSESDKEKLIARAKRFTRGNLSELLRRGGFAYTPKKSSNGSKSKMY